MLLQTWGKMMFLLLSSLGSNQISVHCVSLMKRLIWFRLFLVSVYICNNKPHSSNNLGSFLSSFLLYLTIPNIATYNILTVCFPKFQVLVLAVQFENLWVQWSFGEVVIWNTYPIAYLNFYLHFFMIFFFF